MAENEKGRAVVVTTAHRAVFFGYVDGDYDGGKVIVLDQGRMCIYWSADLRGVVGLATSGPNNRCRISPAAKMTLQDVTAVMDCTDEAVKMWEDAPWTS